MHGLGFDGWCYEQRIAELLSLKLSRERVTLLLEAKIVVGG